MTPEIEQLKQELKELDEQFDALRKAYGEKRQQIANAAAAYRDLSVGCQVIEKKTVGFGSTRRTQEQRYVVTRFSYRSYGDSLLSVFGRSLRKDGKEGKLHEINGKWEVVSREASNRELI